MSGAEEIFCTVAFSKTERSEEVMNAATLRKTVERETHKQDEKFLVEAVLKDRRSPDRLRTLCSNEEECKYVRAITAATAFQGVGFPRPTLPSEDE